MFVALTDCPHRFIVMTAFKILLVLINKVITLHRMIYKNIFGLISLIALKEMVKKYRPFEDEHFNRLQIFSLNACVSQNTRQTCLTFAFR